MTDERLQEIKRVVNGTVSDPQVLRYFRECWSEIEDLQKKLKEARSSYLTAVGASPHEDYD